MALERSHDLYMDFAREGTQSIDSSIFWSQLRQEYDATFVAGKAEVVGWRGKGYDPRIGEYKGTKIYV